MNKIIILAAGKGVRMQLDLPKVLVPLNGQPMIKYLIESVQEAAIDPKPIIIVSPANQELIKEALKDYDLEYVVQEKQLGTGHAVSCAQGEINDNIENIIILNGDHPFIKAETISNLSKIHSGILTMLTVKLDDFNDWRKSFYHWGRIVRQDGQIKAIVEFKDASEEVKKMHEVNPAVYCFNSRWLWQNINKLKNKNAQKEFYLTDLVNIVFQEGEVVNSLAIDAKEAIGINSKEELEIAEKLI